MNTIGHQGVRRVQDMLKENGNPEAVFDVSKQTVSEVSVLENENFTQKATQKITDSQIAIINYLRINPKAF